jgi:hypothetical protein
MPRGHEYDCECKNYKVTGAYGWDVYQNGNFRCTKCQTYIAIEGTFIGRNGTRFCRCCKNPVRSKPKSKRLKERFNENKKKKIEIGEQNK